ncbi:GTPase-activating protein [Saccharomycopsis crataegensis]|uniref:GTPase-activating protein n=1 Tax=Saccharomycopsis crataegensis TaxID=43959 RepID=A0AAV5QWC6_9ASCO|nr:GTPase-activating protein [Saccharomycopsis crataegensis]
MPGDNRVSIDSQFSFESTKQEITMNSISEKMATLKINTDINNESMEKKFDINTISLAEIQNLKFDGDVPDLLKLSFVKSLLIKLSLATNNVNHSSNTYKSLVKDVDEELNSKLNSIFIVNEEDATGNNSNTQSSATTSQSTKTFQTLDPKILVSSSSSLDNQLKFSKSEVESSSKELDTEESILKKNNQGIFKKSLEIKDHIDSLTPSTSNREPTGFESPYNYSEASSEYGGDNNNQPGTSQSNVSSNYNSKSNSKVDLRLNDDPDVIESQSRNSSIYSPKSTSYVSEAINQSQIPNSPSTTYSNNRIQLPSPRVETYKDSSSMSNKPLMKANVASPIIMNDMDNIEKHILPERVSHESSASLVDAKINKSYNSVGLAHNDDELEKEMDKERLKRNPNRGAPKKSSDDVAALTPKSQRSKEVKQHNDHAIDFQPRVQAANSQSAKGSPIIGRNSPIPKGSPVVHLDSGTPKMYGMGIMGLDSPAIVRRDHSPSSPREGDAKQMTGVSKKANSLHTNQGVAGGHNGQQNPENRMGITNISNPRERFYQSVKGKPVYSAYTNISNSEKRHVKSPTLSSVSTMPLTLDSIQPKLSKSQPSTPQSSTFSDGDIDMDNDTTLFIQPKELNTISLKLITSLSINKNNSSSFDPTMVFVSIDKKSQKEIWRFKKKYSQCIQLDSSLRELFDSFLLPPFPDKSIFLNNLPAKIDVRRNGILDYFGTLFNTPLPKKAVYQICKFISSNTVNPLDDIEYNFSNEINEKAFKKQGYLVRRNKGLGANWRVRYCRCEGPNFLVYDELDGNLIDSIRLSGAQIGRQQSDNSSEESTSNAKGYRHALLLKEMKKNSIGSGSNKHIFCAETDEERDSWINTLIEYVSDNSAYDNEPVELQNNLPAINNGANNSISANSSGTAGVSSSFSASNLISTPRHGHLRTRSTEFPTSISSQNISHNSGESPSVVSPKHENCSEFDDSFREPKKSRKRFFGGIRNKLGNGNAYVTNASPGELDANFSSNDDFQINPVTDLSSFNDTTINTTISTTNNNNGNILTPVKTDELLAQGDFSNDKIFGNSLEQAVKLSSNEYQGERVPSIIFRCLDYLSQTGAGYQEGIFRLSGSTIMIKQLKEKFDTSYDIDLVNMEVRPEINSVTGLLKLYLRELPASVMTNEIDARLHSVLSDYNRNLSNASPQLNRIKVDDKNNTAYLQYMYQLKSLVHQLPPVNRAVLYVLIKYLNTEVLSRNEYNKMNLRNLVIVFSATLSIEPKILAEFFINFGFLWEDANLINEDDRPSVDIGSIPLV